jgi:hypothetical protein
MTATSMVAGDKPKSILLVNPNTTQAMTDALRPVIDSLAIHDVRNSHGEYDRLLKET